MASKLQTNYAGLAGSEGGSIQTIRQAIHGARAALAATLAAAGVDATKTRESARVLNINRGLVWRVSRVVGAEDDMTVAAHLPGNLGLERLLGACRARGVEEGVLQSTREAVRRLHDVMERQSGDRRTLEILLANNGTESTSADLESARRAMFEGGCAVWGVRAEARVRCMVVAPNKSDPTMLDEAGVAGYVGFKRLRRVAWPMSYKVIYKDDGTAFAPPQEEPIDPSSSPGGLPLLREFCQPRDLELHTVRSQNMARHELPAGAVGGAETTTCLFGSMYRRVSTSRRTKPGMMVGSIVLLDTPVERVIFDLFVHRSVPGVFPPEAKLLDRLTRAHGYRPEELEKEAMPIEVSPRRLGPGAAGAVTPRIPWYSRMVDYVMSRLEYSPDEFEGYRVEVVYPPIPTAMLVRFELGE